MEYINNKFKKLVDQITYMNALYETRTITWNETNKAFEKSLEIIREIKQDNLSDEEYLVLRKLIEKLIDEGIDGPVTHIRSYKRNRLAELTAKAREELESIPDIEEEEPEKIETINDWIKSLKIFKLYDQFLSTEYYESSYDVYSDMRKIILTKNPPIYKKLYLGRIVDKLEDENNQKTLPNNLTLQVADYELSLLTRLIKDNPDFNFRLMDWSYDKSLIDSRFERGEWVNKLLLLLIKR